MLRINTALILFLFLSLNYSFGQSAGSFPVFNYNDIAGVEITLTRTFSDESLYGYIDGGAELYLEYGFDSLVVNELKVKGRDIKVEVYRMTDAEAAFGIFSVSRFHCNGGVKLTDYYCRSAYQLQICKGPYYISIINDTGSAEDQSLSNQIGEIYIAGIIEDSFNPKLYFPSGVTEEMMKSAVLVRGRLGIFNGIPALSGILETAAGYTALIVREEDSTLASVKFDSEDGVINYMRDQNIDRDALRRGESVLLSSGDIVSMICLQHLLIKAE